MDDANDGAVTGRWNKVLGTGSLGTMDVSGALEEEEEEQEQVWMVRDSDT